MLTTRLGFNTSTLFSYATRNLTIIRPRPFIVQVDTVKTLVANQFPQWKDLKITPVESSGWDNDTFRLGADKLVRMPSAEEYALQVAKEHLWLPNLAKHLPVNIPKPLGLGKPMEKYPWNWSIYEWIAGETAASVSLERRSENKLAEKLAEFINTLERIDVTNGPVPGPHNFYRGGDLQIYDAQTRKALDLLTNDIDTKTAIQIWELALASKWKNPPVWIHGDFSPGNIILRNHRLHGIIDFGGMGIGDPACDLTIAWTLLSKNARQIFKKNLQLDQYTWDRARGWALWKAAIVTANMVGTNVVESKRCRMVLLEIIDDFYSVSVDHNYVKPSRKI